MNASRFFTQQTAVTLAASAGHSVIDLGDVEQAGAEALSLNYEIQQLEQMSAGIQSLQDITEESLQDGGLTAQAYRVIQSQASSIMAAVGHTPVNVNVQSFEGGIADRATATNVCMLSLKTTAQNIWKAIIDAIKEAMEKVKTWFAKMTNAVPSLIKKLEKVRDEASKKNEGLKDDAGEVKLNASSVKAIGTSKTPKIDRAGILAVPGKLGTASVVVRKLSKSIEAANKAAVSELSGLSADKVADVTKAINGAITFVKKYYDDCMNMGEKATAANVTDLGVGEESKILDIGVGNLGIVFNTKVQAPTAVSLTEPTGDAEVDKGERAAAVETTKNLLTASSCQLSVRNIVDKVEDADEFEFKTLTTGEIVSLCNDAVEVLTEFKKYNEDQIKIDSVRKSAIDKASGFAKKADDLKGPEVDPALARLVTDSAKATANIVKNTGSLIPSFAGLTIRSMNTMLGVASDSLKQYK